MDEQVLIGQAPWERMIDSTTGRVIEPLKWFHRFEKFYLQPGERRSLLGAQNLWREANQRQHTPNISGAWRKAARIWGWKKRAESWDIHQRALERLAENKARQEARRNRRILLEGLYAQAANALAGVDVTNVRFADLVKAVDVLSDQIRKEYGDEGGSLIWDVNIQYEALTDDQLERLLNGEDPTQVLSGAGQGRRRN